jgi:hypothetical protein
MTSEMTKSYALSDGEALTPSQLRAADKRTQLDAMRVWFEEHFSDPNILPYDSAEGGYQWIWGGPFDADEELPSEFGGLIGDDVIEELASELVNENMEWSGNPDLYQPEDNELYDLSLLDFSPYDNLCMNLDRAEQAAGLRTVGLDEQFIHRLLYGSLITTLETYLADRFRGLVQGKPDMIQKFIETDPKLRDIKISLSGVAAMAKNLEKKVLDHLNAIIWHRLPEVAKMYNDTLGVVWPDVSFITQAIVQRHDIVHRDGKSVEGIMGRWDESSITALIREIRKLAKDIEDALTSGGSPEPLVEP